MTYRQANPICGASAEVVRKMSRDVTGKVCKKTRITRLSRIGIDSKQKVTKQTKILFYLNLSFHSFASVKKRIVSASHRNQHATRVCSPDIRAIRGPFFSQNWCPLVSIGG
jgi:hypothetical protein